METAADPPNKLPIIDLNEKGLTISSWKSTSDSIRRAMESHGCFVVANYEKTNPDLQKQLFNMWEELFNLPLETKMKCKSKIPGFGYDGNYDAMPLFDAFAIEDGGNLEAVQNFTSLMWPNGHSKFCDSLYSYCKLLSELDRTVMRMLCSSYGLDKYYDALVESSFYMTRVIKYKTQQGERERKIGLDPHRDKSFMAVISTNEAQGLEIETKDGDWIDYEPSPLQFVVIAGEAIMAWSNGRIYCPLHRVIPKGTKEKHSIGVFSFVRETLKVPEELVDDEHPLKFKPFSNVGFLEYCNTAWGETTPGAIHDYCGI